MISFKKLFKHIYFSWLKKIYYYINYKKYHINFDTFTYKYRSFIYDYDYVVLKHFNKYVNGIKRCRSENTYNDYLSLYNLYLDDYNDVQLKLKTYIKDINIQLKYCKKSSAEYNSYYNIKKRIQNSNLKPLTQEYLDLKLKKVKQYDKKRKLNKDFK